MNNSTTAMTMITTSGATGLKVVSQSGGENRSGVFGQGVGMNCRGVTGNGATGVLGTTNAGRGVAGFTQATTGQGVGVFGRSEPSHRQRPTPSDGQPFRPVTLNSAGPGQARREGVELLTIVLHDTSENGCQVAWFVLG